MKLSKLSCCCLSMLSLSVFADEYHYTNLLVGGKAIGYGGAFVAIADDLSAMHYNPAGLSFQNSRTSASVNTMAWEKTKFVNAFRDGSDFTRDSFAVVPGFIGISGHSGAFSYGTFFTMTDFSQERTASDAIYTIPANDGLPAQNINEFVDYDLDNSGYKLGFSGAYEIEKNFSIGLTMALRYLEVDSVQGSGVTISFDGPAEDFYNGFNAHRRITEDSLLIEPTLGILWTNKQLRIGAKIAKNFSLYRDFANTSTISAPLIIGSPTAQTLLHRSRAESDKQQAYPVQITGGFAYAFEKVTISTQIDYYESVSDNESDPQFAIPVTRDLASVTNYAIGVRVAITDKSAIKLGYFTDNSNGVIDTSIAFQRAEDIDIDGISVSFESEVYDYPYTIGIYAKNGEGDVRYSDVRFVDNILGTPVYPASDNFDITRAEKASYVVFASMEF